MRCRPSAAVPLHATTIRTAVLAALLPALAPAQAVTNAWQADGSVTVACHDGAAIALDGRRAAVAASGVEARARPCDRVKS